MVGKRDVESCDEEVEGLARCVLVHGAKGRLLDLAIERGKRRGRRERCRFFIIGVFKRSEEFLITVNVLARIGLDASVHRALGAFVGKCLRQAGEFGEFNVFHRTRLWRTG